MTAKSTIIISADRKTVWNALTTPEIIARYLYGTKAESDWQKGSTITYIGEWNGTPYEDKGIITAIQENELLVTEYWSSFSGLPDIPENYVTVSYIVQDDEEGTRLTVEQSGCKDESDSRKKAEDWDVVLQALRDCIE